MLTAIHRYAFLGLIFEAGTSVAMGWGITHSPYALHMLPVYLVGLWFGGMLMMRYESPLMRLCASSAMTLVIAFICITASRQNWMMLLTALAYAVIATFFMWNCLAITTPSIQQMPERFTPDRIKTEAIRALAFRERLPAVLPGIVIELAGAVAIGWSLLTGKAQFLTTLAYVLATFAGSRVNQMRGGSLLRCVSALISASLMAVFCAEAALEHAVYWIGVVGFAAVGYRYIRHIREYSAD